MNIALMDTWNGKFSKPIREHWESLGHKVVVNAPYDVMEQADVTFCYQSDNCAVDASNKPRKGKLFVQAVDIEVWAGQAGAVNWANVDGALFMAPHIKDRVDVGKTPWKIIKPGIDVQKWTLKKEFNALPKYLISGKVIDTSKLQPGGVVDVDNVDTVVPLEATPIRRIAYVVGDRRIWDVKRLDIAMQILKDLMTSGQNIWQLHVRGTYSSHEQYNAYCRYLEKDLKLDGHIFWYPEKVEDLNAWLEDKDYLLLPSTKEAFSYVTAQAMCKGIKPIINNWEGSKETWGDFVSETQGQMLFKFLREPYEAEKYRKFIVDNYNEERYFSELDEFLLT